MVHEKDIYKSPYTTFNGLTVRWTQANKKHHVTIEGDNVKTLYDGDNMGKASKAFRDTVDLYEYRKAHQAEELAEEKARIEANGS